jgi:hypothetical protein
MRRDSIRLNFDVRLHCDVLAERIDAFVGVKPALRCWMELNEG